jgi:hypothetical protein
MYNVQIQPISDPSKFAQPSALALKRAQEKAKAEQKLREKARHWGAGSAKPKADNVVSRPVPVRAPTQPTDAQRADQARKQKLVSGWNKGAKNSHFLYDETGALAISGKKSDKPKQRSKRTPLSQADRATPRARTEPAPQPKSQSKPKAPKLVGKAVREQYQDDRDKNPHLYTEPASVTQATDPEDQKKQQRLKALERQWNQGVANGGMLYDQYGNLVMAKPIFRDQRNAYQMPERKKWVSKPVDADLIQLEQEEEEKRKQAEQENNDPANKNDNHAAQPPPKTSSARRQGPPPKCKSNAKLVQFAEEIRTTHELLEDTQQTGPTVDEIDHTALDRAYEFKLLLDKLEEYNQLQREQEMSNAQQKQLQLQENANAVEVADKEMALKLEAWTVAETKARRQEDRQLLSEQRSQLQHLLDSLAEREAKILQRERALSDRRAVNENVWERELQTMQALLATEREQWDASRAALLQAKAELRIELEVTSKTVLELDKAHSADMAHTHRLEEENVLLKHEIDDLKRQLQLMEAEGYHHITAHGVKDKTVLELQTLNAQLVLDITTVQRQLDAERLHHGNTHADLQRAREEHLAEADAASRRAHEQRERLRKEQESKEAALRVSEPVFVEETKASAPAKPPAPTLGSTYHIGWASGPVKRSAIILLEDRKSNSA